MRQYSSNENSADFVVLVHVLLWIIPHQLFFSKVQNIQSVLTHYRLDFVVVEFVSVDDRNEIFTSMSFSIKKILEFFIFPVFSKSAQQSFYLTVIKHKAILLQNLKAKVRLQIYQVNQFLSGFHGLIRECWQICKKNLT